MLHFPLLNLAFQDIVDPFFLPDTDGAPSDTSDTNSVVGVGGRKEDKGKNNRSIFSIFIFLLRMKRQRTLVKILAR